MNHSFETAFCNHDTRNFLFVAENSIINFLNNSKGLIIEHESMSKVIN